MSLLIARLAPLTLLASCDTGAGVGAARDRIIVSMPVSIVAAGAREGYATQEFEVRVQPFYRRATGERVLLGSRTVQAAGSEPTGQTQVQFSLAIGECLADPLREEAPSGTCALRMEVSLLLSNGGLTLDLQHAGPVAVVAERTREVLDRVDLVEVGVPSVTPRSSVIPVGGTVQMQASFLTVRGDRVIRPVQWRSEAPAVARVDAVTGLVTGLAPGNVGIIALFGYGQSSNGQVVQVR